MATTIHEITWSRETRRLAIAVLLVSVAALAAVLDLSRFPALPVVLGLAALWALLFRAYRVMYTLRVVIDGADLVVICGLSRRRIPLHSIDRVSLAHCRSVEWDGRSIPGGQIVTRYFLPGDEGRAVELTLQGGERVLFSATDPEAVAGEIRERRALLPAPRLPERMKDA